MIHLFSEPAIPAAGSPANLCSVDAPRALSHRNARGAPCTLCSFVAAPRSGPSRPFPRHPLSDAHPASLPLLRRRPEAQLGCEVRPRRAEPAPGLLAPPGGARRADPAGARGAPDRRVLLAHRPAVGTTNSPRPSALGVRAALQSLSQALVRSFDGRRRREPGIGALERRDLGRSPDWPSRGRALRWAFLERRQGLAWSPQCSRERGV